jgi:hypothetical protein
MAPPFPLLSFRNVPSDENKTPGNIMSFRVFGQVIVVLNSVKVAKDLLEKNGDVYVDRPAIPFYEMWVVRLFFEA